MQPQQPQQPQTPYIPPPNGQNQYDFILNPEKPKHSPKMPSFGSGEGSALKRGLLVGAMAVVLIIVLLVVKAIISGGGENLGLEFTPVLRQQQELIHITNSNSNTNLAQLSASNSYAAATVQAVITSEQGTVEKYLTTNKVKLDSAAITAAFSADVDQQLSSAAQSGIYDSTFANTLKSEIGDYKATLQSAYTKVKGAHGRALLSKYFDQADLLLQQFDRS